MGAVHDSCKDSKRTSNLVEIKIKRAMMTTAWSSKPANSITQATLYIAQIKGDVCVSFHNLYGFQRCRLWTLSVLRILFWMSHQADRGSSEAWLSVRFVWLWHHYGAASIGGNYLPPTQPAHWLTFEWHTSLQTAIAFIRHHRIQPIQRPGGRVLNRNIPKHTFLFCPVRSATGAERGKQRARRQ